MAKVLVSFLGRPPKDQGVYRTTHYRFPGSGADPAAEDQVAFFGWSLARRVKPDKLVIFGTNGSIWDHLLEADHDLGNASEDERLALAEAVEQKAVTAELLAPIAPLLAQTLGVEVRLELLPHCIEPGEQVDLLKTLASHLDDGDELELDVTHAFRHLPMIGLMGALYLREARDITISRVWYGAYDNDTKDAPVHDLVGLLRISDWVTALATYDKDGRYGVFADLLPPELGAMLREADFLESVNQVGRARGKAKEARAALERHLDGPAPSDAAAALFYPELKQRLDWVDGNRHYHRQRDLALRHLAGDRFVQAAVGGYEAFITRLVQRQGGSPDQIDGRNAARESYHAEQTALHPRTAEFRQWGTLSRLRNTLAHGTPAKGADVQSALSNRDAMHQLMSELFATLLPAE